MLMTVIVLAFSLVIGMPIAFVLGLSGVTELFMADGFRYFTVIATKLFDGVNRVSLTCVPFFIMTGEIMNGGGVTQRLIGFMRDLVGHVRGGLAYVCVLVSMVLAAILGQANAVATIMGAVMVPEMKKDGYPEAYTGALCTASAILGPIIPPSTTFVLFATLANVSIKSLFIAGIVPGILLGGGYAIKITLDAKKRNFPKAEGAFDFKAVFKSFLNALPALMIPVIILGGIMGGFFTPTESGAVAVFASLFAGFFYRSLKIKDLPNMFVKTAISTSAVFLIMAFGNIISWGMSIDGVPALIVSTIRGLTTNKHVIILIALVFMTIIGCFLDATAALVIFTPVFYELLVGVGMDPVHYGLIFCVMIIIGLATPPVGMTLFVTSNTTGIKLSDLCREIWPFVGVALFVTVALAYLPGVVMFLPNLIG
ncbi:MAG: TRAP transporter large permease [Clostridiales bacterium]|nr:TRAP transporter large permease [Clostridiales bacterium]